MLILTKLNIEKIIMNKIIKRNGFAEVITDNGETVFYGGKEAILKSIVNPTTIDPTLSNSEVMELLDMERMIKDGTDLASLIYIIKDIKTNLGFIIEAVKNNSKGQPLINSINLIKEQCVRTIDSIEPRVKNEKRAELFFVELQNHLESNNIVPGEKEMLSLILIRESIANDKCYELDVNKDEDFVVFNIISELPYSNIWIDFLKPANGSEFVNSSPSM